MMDNVRRLAPDARVSGVTIEPMLERPHAREIMVGITSDPVFGPVISFGAGGTAVQDLSVTVTPVNDNDPVITSSATPSVAENTTAVVNLTATDADLPGQTVSFSITGGADSALFQLVGGQLEFIAAPDYEAPADADANNIYQVQVTADDGAGRTAVQNLSATVTPVNDNDPVNVVGVVETLQAPWQGWSGVEKSMLVPQLRATDFVRYIVRAEPGMRDQLMPEIEAMLAASNKDRIIRDMVTMDEVRKLAYVGDAALVKILGFVVVLLTIITALGIVGLASFNVSRRTRQIGIRRALGATRPAIVRYFMIENSIVSAIGIVIGGILAIALNIAMVEAYSLEPLAWYVIPAGVLALWAVGQLAVAGPARKASNIAPAIATRSS